MVVNKKVRADISFHLPTNLIPEEMAGLTEKGGRIKILAFIFEQIHFHAISTTAMRDTCWPLRRGAAKCGGQYPKTAAATHARFGLL